MVSLLKSKVKFLLSAGTYQNMEFWFESDGDPLDLVREVEAKFTNEIQERFGVLHAEAESWFRGAREGTLDGTHEKAVKTASEALGAPVVAEEDTPEAEAPAAWSEPVEAAPKPWQDKPADTDTDDEDW